MTSNQASQPMDAAVVDELLDRLSSDDGFRDLFATDPRAALAQIGHVVPADDPLLCAQTTVLASKEELAAAREALREHLTSAVTMTVIFNFEAGKVEQSLGKN
ncbi:putative modified peptide [Pseudoxanthomonas jiangsuensis]|uniref:NHLP-related RiPP peptide n=1 Tax=Pseudoxanthomonas jiangsuensis TaxID=619688 RepID=UPI0013915592|nr:NHLP-related RiPP peptide [Pseudoxanthomonas jiangsuensis]KAF1699145.1 putative modified peptide [Pseudoxanthomonas jiangsuensis]